VADAPSRERYPGRIVVSDYDPNWPAQFETERRAVARAFGAIALTIEHVGSTAVPGLAAKPIIDLLVGVTDVGTARHRVEAMRSIGYTYMSEYRAWLPGEMLYRKGPPGPWTHHVHVMEPSSPRWDELVLVRDYLRAHREIAAAYGELKKALAVLFEDDIEGFRDAKRPFLAEVLRRARLDQAPANLR
jgi:GrpB-like predicted nucleotidyltransferase (UPF0157 family)